MIRWVSRVMLMLCFLWIAYVLSVWNEINHGIQIYVLIVMTIAVVVFGFGTWLELTD